MGFLWEKNTVVGLFASSNKPTTKKREEISSVLGAQATVVRWQA